MALIPVAHRPQTAHARQFDGSLESFLDILQARSPAGLVATVAFDESGQFAHMSLSGGAVLGAVEVGIGDWAVFPDDPTQPAFGMPNDRAVGDWQPT